MPSKVISKEERKIWIPGDSDTTERSAKITIPKAWLQIIGFEESGEEVNVFLMHGKHGYFLAVAPKVQRGAKEDFVLGDEVVSSSDEKTND